MPRAEHSAPVPRGRAAKEGRKRRPWAVGAARRSVVRQALGRGLADIGAERTRRIDAQDLQLRREKGQFLESEAQAPVLRMALHVGIELGGEELAFELIRLELGHVDAVGGEAAERLVE